MLYKIINSIVFILSATANAEPSSCKLDEVKNVNIQIYNSTLASRPPGRHSILLRWEYDSQRVLGQSIYVLEIDTYTYSSIFLNFLELSTIQAWLGDTPLQQGGVIQARLSLLNAQLKHSPNLLQIWNDLMREISDKERIDFLALQNPNSEQAWDLLNSREERTHYFEFLAKNIVKLGQLFAEEKKLNSNFLTETSILQILKEPMLFYPKWRLLVKHLIQWQFAEAQDIILDAFCLAKKNNQKGIQLIVPESPYKNDIVELFLNWTNEL